MGVGRGVSPPEGCDGLRAHVSLSPLRPSLTLGKVDVRVRQGEYGTIPTAGDGRRHCRWVKEEKTWHTGDRLAGADGIRFKFLGKLGCRLFIVL